MKGYQIITIVEQIVNAYKNLLARKGRKSRLVKGNDCQFVVANLQHLTDYLCNFLQHFGWVDLDFQEFRTAKPYPTIRLRATKWLINTEAITHYLRFPTRGFRRYLLGRCVNGGKKKFWH